MSGRIVLLGAPGAGKGTQARRLSSDQGWPQISTGDIFRSHVSNETEIGNTIEEYMRSGQLVPDELTVSIVSERLSQDDCAEGFILDGFPRTVAQAEALDHVLEGRGEQLDAVLMMEVDDDEIVDRLTARRTCGKCGTIYNLRFDPPADSEVCGREGCGGPLLHREDDQEDVIRERLATYYKSTEPLVTFYEAKGLLRRAGGPGKSPDEVYADVTEALKPPAAA